MYKKDRKKMLKTYAVLVVIFNVAYFFSRNSYKKWGITTWKKYLLSLAQRVQHRNQTKARFKTTIKKQVVIFTIENVQ